MIQDRCGKSVRQNQVVDIHLNAIFQAVVVHVEQVSAIQRKPGFVVVQVTVTVPSDLKDRVPLWVTSRDSDKVDGEIEAGVETEKFVS